MLQTLILCILNAAIDLPQSVLQMQPGRGEGQGWGAAAAAGSGLGGLAAALSWLLIVGRQKSSTPERASRAILAQLWAKAGYNGSN